MISVRKWKALAEVFNMRQSVVQDGPEAAYFAGECGPQRRSPEPGATNANEYFDPTNQASGTRPRPNPRDRRAIKLEVKLHQMAGEAMKPIKVDSQNRSENTPRRTS
jgi:hypothetical protein